MEEYLHNELTSKIIDAFYKVYNWLGFGFLEKVYENALKYELELMKLKVEKQKPIDVYYKEMKVGKYSLIQICGNQFNQCHLRAIGLLN